MTALVVVAAAAALAGLWRVRPAPRRARTARLRAPGHRSVPAVALVATALVGLVVLSPLLAALGLVGIAARPHLRRVRAAQRQRAAIEQAMPELLDLLVVALGAGLTPPLAFDRLARAGPEVARPGLAEMRRRVDRGVRFADALAALTEVLGEQARPLVTTLRAGALDGVPLAPTLDVLAREARERRRRTAEAAARRLPVRLAFPLTLCILPAFVVLTVVPLLAGALAGLQP